MDTSKPRKTSKKYINATITLIGIISAVLGIYVFFFPETKKSLLEYEILSNTNVFDINTELQNLDIIYDSMSLKKNKQNLRIFNVRLKNNGNETVLRNFYDEKSPLTLSVKNGYFIETPQIINTSSEYLTKNVKPALTDDGRIFFNQVILEPSEFFTLKLLVLHQAKDTPLIISSGKVAGQYSIPVISLIQPIKTKQSIWVKSFKGDIFTQLLRLMFYFLALLITFILILGLTEKIGEARASRRRKKIVNSFKSKAEYKDSAAYQYLFQQYIKGNNKLIYSLEYLADEEKLNQAYIKWHQRLDELSYQSQLENVEMENSDIYTDYEDPKQSVWPDLETQKQAIQHKIKTVNNLLNAGYLVKNNNRLIINQAMKNELETFSQFANPIHQKSFFPLKEDDVSFK